MLGSLRPMHPLRPAALALVASAALCGAAPPPSTPGPDPSPAAPALKTEPATPTAPPEAVPTDDRPTEVPAHGTGHVAGTEAKHRGDRWFALPVLFYLPETKLGFGATGGLHLQLRGAPRPSSFFAAAVYTLERQGSVDVAGDVYVRGGPLVSGRVRAVHFPDVFYGIGTHTHEGDREKFTRRSAEAVVTAEFPIVSALRAGPRLDLRVEEIQDRAPDGALAAGTVTGWDGYSAAGIGGSVSWDTRDNTFWTSRGTLAQAWYVYAPESIGRSHGFGRGVLEARRFLPLGGGRTLGLHGYLEGAHGDPPFTLLAKLGSTRFLRGIREGRYRDRFDWMTQTELRVPVRGRFSATAFAAVGDVAPNLDAFSLETMKLAGGAGLRFRLTDAGANIRLDVAASRLGVELYVLVLEAF